MCQRFAAIRIISRLEFHPFTYRSDLSFFDWSERIILQPIEKSLTHFILTTSSNRWFFLFLIYENRKKTIGILIDIFLFRLPGMGRSTPIFGRNGVGSIDQAMAWSDVGAPSIYHDSAGWTTLVVLGVVSKKIVLSVAVCCHWITLFIAGIYVVYWIHVIKHEGIGVHFSFFIRRRIVC